MGEEGLVPFPIRVIVFFLFFLANHEEQKRGITTPMWFRMVVHMWPPQVETQRLKGLRRWGPLKIQFYPEPSPVERHLLIAKLFVFKIMEVVLLVGTDATLIHPHTPPPTNLCLISTVYLLPCLCVDASTRHVGSWLRCCWFWRRRLAWWGTSALGPSQMSRQWSPGFVHGLL